MCHELIWVIPTVELACQGLLETGDSGVLTCLAFGNDVRDESQPAHLRYMDVWRLVDLDEIFILQRIGYMDPQE
jgi:hypothetical protein